jgi:hypothetical protein
MEKGLRRIDVMNTITESPSPGYPARTIDNVANSDATLAILWSPHSTGTVNTVVYAMRSNWAKDTWRYWNPKAPRSSWTTYRPYCVIETRDVDEAEDVVAAWIAKSPSGSVKKLNVAGHRESTQPGVQLFTNQLVQRLIICGYVTERIISGGQTGADRGAWDGAMELDFPICGMVLKGRRCEVGVIPVRYFSYGR